MRQRVEILKALYRDADILILDEPTAVLTPQETRELFLTMRRLAENGRSIIFITHKLREVLAVSDRISVMRHGRIISTEPNKSVTAQHLASLMVGRSVLLRVDKTKARPSEERLLEVEGLTAHRRSRRDGGRGRLLRHPGGRDRRARGRSGQRPGRAHRVHRRPAPPGFGPRRDLRRGVSAHADPRARREAGLAYIPADRERVGLSLTSPVWENLTVGHLPAFSRGPILKAKAARRRAGELIRKFDVRGARDEHASPARSRAATSRRSSSRAS